MLSGPPADYRPETLTGRPKKEADIEKDKEGNILVIRTDDRKIQEAADILRRNGASDVETH